MKIQDYFGSIKEKELSSTQKELIFRSFEAKKWHNLFVKKAASWVRPVSFAFSFAFLAWWIYFLSYFSDIAKRESNDAYVALQIDEESSLSLASEVGEIIAVKGDVRISNDGIISESANLYLYDKVLLLDGAELVFTLQGDVEAKILWPAEFNLEKEGEAYVINMISWTFLEVRSLEKKQEIAPEEEEQKDEEIKSKVAKKKFELIVKTEEFEVVSDAKSETIDMTIVEKDGKQVVQNSGDNLIIRKIIEDKRVVTELKTQQMASINGVIEVIALKAGAVLEEEEAVVVADSLKNSELTIAYQLGADGEKDSKEIEKILANLDANTDGASFADSLYKYNQELDEPNQFVWDSDESSSSFLGDMAARQQEKALWKEEIINKEEENAEVTKVKSNQEELPNMFDLKSTIEIDEEVEKVDEELQEKNVIWWAELDLIRSFASYGKLKVFVDQIRVSHENEDEEAWAQWRKNLWILVSPLWSSSLWGVRIDSSSTSTLAQTMETNISRIQERRFIPPEYIAALQSIVAELRWIE